MLSHSPCEFLVNLSVLVGVLLAAMAWLTAWGLSLRTVLAGLGVTVSAPLAVLVFAAAHLALPPGSPLVAGLTLNAAAPSLLSAPAYALIVGVDALLATVLSVLTTLAAPFSIPLVAEVLLGSGFAFDAPSLLLRLLAIVAVILGGAWLGRRVLGQARIERYGDHIDALVVVTIAAFGIGLMDGVRAVLIEQPGYALLAILLAFALNIILQAAAVGLFWRWGRGVSATTALVSGNRNMAIVLAAVADVASPDVILYIVVAQFPIFSLPLLMRPAFAWLQGATTRQGGSG